MWTARCRGSWYVGGVVVGRVGMGNLWSEARNWRDGLSGVGGGVGE